MSLLGKLTVNLLTKEQLSSVSGVDTQQKNLFWGNDNQLYLTPKENEIATSDELGMIKVGTDFDISTDGTLSLYNALSLSTNIVPSVAEKGSTVSSVSIKWSTNKVPLSLTIDGVEVDDP